MANQRLQEEFFPIPTGGWNTDIDPKKLPKDVFTSMSNCDVKNGTLQVRKGITSLVVEDDIVEHRTVNADYNLSGVKTPTEVTVTKDTDGDIEVFSDFSDYTSLATGYSNANLYKYKQGVFVHDSSKAARNSLKKYSYETSNVLYGGGGSWDLRNTYPLKANTLPYASSGDDTRDKYHQVFINDNGANSDLLVLSREEDTVFALSRYDYSTATYEVGDNTWAVNVSN